MKNSNFKSDLAKAKTHEKAVCNLFKNSGWNTQMAPDRYFPDYDFTIEKDGIEERIELKVDYAYKRTGNVCVEYSKADGITPSGVTVGDSNDYVMYMMPDAAGEKYESFIIRRHTLKDIAEKKHKFIAQCPDRNGWCYIVPLDAIKDNGIKTSYIYEVGNDSTGLPVLSRVQC